MHPSTILIGDYILPVLHFDDLDLIFQEFESVAFQTLSKRKQFKRINQILLNLILKADNEVFLLSSVVDYISRINSAHLLPEVYTLALFEFWLNHFAALESDVVYLVRAKIMGKKLPREAYQCLFPLGSENYYPGTHFVTAHLSPDLDTTIGSFWGWVDAFAATVGAGQHLWCLPGGPPSTPMMHVFDDLFGPDLYKAVARTSLTLTLTAADLVTQKNFTKRTGETSISTIDHGVNEKAVILVDASGHYCGDWRSSDVELVRQIIVMFKSCLHWFENNLHIELISLFAKRDLTVDDIHPFLVSIIDIHIGSSEATQELNEKQRHDLNLFFTHVLGIAQGIECTYDELSQAMCHFGVQELALFLHELQELSYSSLFDIQGRLVENRSSLLHILERVIIQLDIAIHCVRNYVERLDMAMEIKNKVIKQAPQQYITLNSDVEEIRLKMKNYDYLTVVISEENDKLFPVGVVWDDDLYKPILGTVSFRDFSNHDEVRMAPYLAVISVIDHHRTALTTSSVPMVLIGDTQSSNILLAEIAFGLNDHYSLRGMTAAGIAEQLACLREQPVILSAVRIQQRLLHAMWLAQRGSPGFVHPHREYAEYLTFLYAILDDTDLLTKVTARDVICVGSLLNRLKSLIVGKEVEIIHFDDLTQDATFAKKAARRILQQEDMYSIYYKLYADRTREVEEQITCCGRGEPSDFFVDTKELNKCCRVGQTKLFASNIPTFQYYSAALRRTWREEAMDSVASHPEIDLHLHMISTIASAEEVHDDHVGNYSHRDELWFWGPSTRQAYVHLSTFLLGFQNIQEVRRNHLELEILAAPEEASRIEELFRRHFIATQVTVKPRADGLWAVLYFDAGSINSRKAMITPSLPRIVV